MAVIVEGGSGVTELITGIKITSIPTKTAYMAGDILDISGMVVSVVSTDGDTETLTPVTDYTLDPAAGTILYESAKSFTVTWSKDGKSYSATQSITVTRTLSSIKITTMPSKTSYNIGDKLDLTDMVVTATFNSGATEDVTSSVTSSPASGSAFSVSGDQTITISYSESSITKDDSFTVTVANPIYGVNWDGTATTILSRTDAAAEFTDPVPYISGASSYGSPFDNIKPWSDMKRVTDSVAGEVVSIPKFYYKLTQTGAAIKLQISSSLFDGASVSPAHQDRGDGKGERDVVYVGRYHCCSTYKSTTGQNPVANITRSAARSSIHALGSTVYQYDMAMRVTIEMLYLVEFADWNSQIKIGYGCSTGGSVMTMGYTDSMPYHTGTMESSRTTYGRTQYRYIEGLWDNAFDWLDGCYYSSAGMSIIKNPNNFSDSSNGTAVGTPASGWPSALKVPTVTGLDWAFYPSTASGSDSTYIPDNWNFDASSPCLRSGGSCGQSLYRGFFYVYCSGASDTDADLGCRLQVLPG